MAGAHGSRSNYSDAPSEGQPFLPTVHSISKLDDPRRHDPKHPGSASKGVKLSLFSEFATGDWSWKPFRDRVIGEDFRSFKGVPPGAAELHGRVSCPRT